MNLLNLILLLGFSLTFWIQIIIVMFHAQENLLAGAKTQELATRMAHEKFIKSPLFKIKSHLWRVHYRENQIQGRALAPQNTSFYVQLEGKLVAQ